MDFSPLDAFSNLLETYRVMDSSTEGVLDDLAFLKAVLMDPPQQFIEESQSVATEADLIISSFDLERIDETMVRQLCKSLANPLRRLWLLTNKVRTSYNDKSKQLKPLRDDFPTTGQLGFVDHLVEYLEELLKVKADSIGPLKPYFFRLQQKLKFLSSHLMKIPKLRREEADLKDLIRRITNLAYEVEFVVDSFLVGDIAIWYCMFWLRDILTEVKHKKRLIMIDSGDKRSILKCILPKVPVKFNIIPIVNIEISKTLREVFDASSIIRKFSARSWSLVSSYEKRRRVVFHQLLDHVSYYPHPFDFGRLDQENYTCETSLDELEKSVHVRLKIQNYWSQDELEKSIHVLLKNNKYLIILEDVRDIDALNDIRRALPNCHDGSTILLTTPTPELAVSYRYGSRVSRDQTSTSQIEKPTTPDEDMEDMVGFQMEKENMLDLLTGEPTKLCIISIIGMAGQGKTFLAKKLYTDPLVCNHFNVRAWCCVSQVYKKRELLLELLCQVGQNSNTINREKDVELAAMLKRSLLGLRFLIVLDDMWSTGALDDLNQCFPDKNNGSRIIFTSQLIWLSSQLNSTLQSLCPLSENESWKLLERKLFRNGSCSPSLSVVGRQIAKSCKGLPLSIVLIAGLLGKIEKNVDNWEQIAQTFRAGKAPQFKAIIELSYKHLPNHLKPCFLYFGAFLEHKQVSVQKLIRLWIAEGFIKHINSKSLEDVANDYLMDLIGRNLVTVAQEKSNGGVKSCCVHDLLHDFCLTKANEENFLQLTSGYDQLFSSSSNNPDYGLYPTYSYCKRPITYHLRRLCVYSKRNHFIMLKPYGPFIRSLLLLATSDMCPSHAYDISFISGNFKLLRVLDLEDINIGDSFEAIAVLIHLRYLAVQGYIDVLPSSISNIWNLQTFLVKTLIAKVVKVPDTIWDMAKLRHLHINEIASFVLEPHIFEKSSVLGNLQTFSTPSLAFGDNMEKILRKLPGIRKLKCIFLDSWDDARNCNQFPALEFLNQLVSLNVLYNGKGKHPCKFDFPSNLRKLTLSKFRMPWSGISQLAMLPNLEVLKLLDNAFVGETWEMEGVVFEKLKFLKLDTLNVVKWSASSNNFTCLERLLLHNCEQLEKIPQDIGNIPTLLIIEVMWCGPDVAASAKEIQDEQQEYSGKLKVHILPTVFDSELSSSNA